jgi:hypothetical protein
MGAENLKVKKKKKKKKKWFYPHEFTDWNGSLYHKTVTRHTGYKFCTTLRMGEIFITQELAGHFRLPTDSPLLCIQAVSVNLPITEHVRKRSDISAVQKTTSPTTATDAERNAWPHVTDTARQELITKRVCAQIATHSACV